MLTVIYSRRHPQAYRLPPEHQNIQTTLYCDKIESGGNAQLVATEVCGAVTHIPESKVIHISISNTKRKKR